MPTGQHARARSSALQNANPAVQTLIKGGLLGATGATFAMYALVGYGLYSFAHGDSRKAAAALGGAALAWYIKRQLCDGAVRAAQAAGVVS